MPAVQVVHPPGYPAERAYTARVVLKAEYSRHVPARTPGRAECKAVRGDFTFLWHDNRLVTDGQRRLLQAAFGETT